jgi:DNA-binding CsgD family transcriptional regulator
MPALFQDGPSGLAITHSPADASLRTVLENGRTAPNAMQGASIPLPAGIDGQAAIVHLVPVLGNARDVFARTACLAVVTPLDADRVPDARLVQGLFDLTPAEARIARDVARGLNVPTLAQQTGVSVNTVRSQLKAVFAKTGTRRQSELAALLNGIVLLSGQADQA